MKDVSRIFITIEGIEGVGKSTAVTFLKNYFYQEKKDVLVTREPGGTEIAEHIRNILLTPNYKEKMLPETELLLMFAARIQHIHHVILPAFQEGKIVICDRFLDASYAYQGGGREIKETYLNFLSEWLLADLKPNLTILLDAPVEVGLKRAKHRAAHDRIEQETIAFHQRVRKNYLKRAQNEPLRFKIIDATQPLLAIEEAIISILKTGITS